MLLTVAIACLAVAAATSVWLGLRTDLDQALSGDFDSDAAIDAPPDAPEGLPVLLPEVKDYGQYMPNGPSQTWVFTVQAVSPSSGM